MNTCAWLSASGPLARLTLMMAALLALGACASHNHAPERRAADLPLAFTGAGGAGDAPPAVDWWRGFGDRQLSELIDAALADSPDLLIAAERVRQAEAQAAIAGASLFPTLNLGLGASRRETHGLGGGASASYSAALNASYDVDVWGQNAAAVRSAGFALRASRFDRQSARLTLLAAVASGYFQLLSMRERVQIAHENIVIAQRAFKVVDARARNGAAAPLDVARQQSALLGQQVALPQLQLQERQLLYALAVLLGKPAQGFAIADAGLLTLNMPEVAAGLPSSLLVRRPDLASAEAQLAAANANVALARAALLPSITLTGEGGIASGVLRDLVSAPTLGLSIGASLLQTLFDGGRLRAQVDIAGARERELALNYRRAILAALAEVENALAARARLSEQEHLLSQSLGQAKRALKLAEVRYREGADDLIVLLDAQRTLFQAEDQVALIRLARLLASLALFKALGG